MANEQRGGSGNFANDRERASEAGKKGGERSHGDQQQQGGESHGQQGGNAGNLRMIGKRPARPAVKADNAR